MNAVWWLNGLSLEKKVIWTTKYWRKYIILKSTEFIKESNLIFFFNFNIGVPGSDGIPGRQGIQGPKGAPGDYGSDGKPGLAGEIGVRWAVYST